MSGLDPLLQRLQREAKKASEDAVPPLEPEFPYRRVRVDPLTFGTVAAKPDPLHQTQGQSA